MDSKGLDVCNSLERDKACWRRCCRDGRKAACHDGPDRLTVGLRALLAPAQFIATKSGEEAQTSCRIFGDLCNHVEGTLLGQYSFESQSSLPCLTIQTAASAHSADLSMPDQSSPNIMAPITFGAIGPASALQVTVKICRGCTNCRAEFLARFR